MNVDYKKFEVDFGFSIIDFRKSIVDNGKSILENRSWEIDLGKSIMGNRSWDIDLGKSIMENRSWKIDLATVHSWLNILEKGRRSSYIYNAFDSVPHATLMAKLQQIKAK